MTRLARFVLVFSSITLSLVLGSLVVGCTRNGTDPPGGDAYIPPGVDGGGIRRMQLLEVGVGAGQLVAVP